MVANHTPFLFNQDFLQARRAPEETFTPAQVAAKILEAERAAFDAGRAQGRQTASGEDAARISATLDRLAIVIAGDTARAEARANEQQAVAIDLAVELSRKIASAAVARFPEAEIEAAANECFAEARLAPHVVVRVNDTIVEPIKAKMQALATERGFSGKLVILGEPEIAPGDVRLEWADGGIIRDAAMISQAIDAAIRKHLVFLQSDQGSAQ